MLTNIISYVIKMNEVNISNPKNWVLRWEYRPVFDSSLANLT